jgi:MFS family permease
VKQSKQYPNTRWLMGAAVIAGQVTIGATMICFAPILGIISKDLGVSVGEISAAAMGTVIMAAAFSSIISGAVLDRFGVPRSIAVGALITTIGMLLAPVFDNSIQQIVLVRILIGVGWGPVSACTSSVAARWFPEEQRGMFAGMVGAGISFGIIIGFIITPAFIHSVSHWSYAIRMVAVVPAIFFVLSLISNFLSEPEVQETIVSEKESSKLSSDMALAFKSPVTYIGIVSMFLFTWVMNAFNDLTPGFIAIEPPIGLGLGPVTAGQFMSAVQVGMLIGSAASGFILMKLFKGKIKPVMVVGFLFAAIFMFSVRLPVINSTSALLAICLFGAGFFEAFIIPMVTTFIATNYPSAITGRIFGITFGISLFGGSIGVFVGSTFLHITGTYLASIAIVTVVGLLGMLTSFLMNPLKAFSHIREEIISQKVSHEQT